MVNNKKILYLITKSVWGGAGKYVYDLAVASKENEYDVAVAAGGQGELAIKLQEKNISYFDVVGLQRDVAFLKPFISGLTLLKILFKFRPDIVHANSPQAAGVGGMAIFLYQLLTFNFGLKKIYTVHGWAFHETRPEWQNFLIRLFSKITCLFYQKIICVSEYDRQSALKLKIAPAHKLITRHNGIGPKDSHFLLREEACQKLGLNPGELIIGTIGEFTKNKGQVYLVEALGILKNNGVKFKSLIIGWGEEYQNLKLKIKNLKLDNEIILINNLSPASPYLKAFDVFVLPSVKEGLPYTLLEAGLAGLPIIATNVGGVPEIIENEKTGLLVKPASANELTKEILRLTKDENLRKKLGQNLCEKILRDFSASEMLKRTFSFYDKISNG